ncbi:MAG: nucleotidyltransferase domain-containing protein [Planctomycetota bacterium]|nr:nucleotidyltransferase domain-containing protein [Planctomycetota bacterium]MDI6788195.1 nucleotidyltransferase domain-containing protein [Planctomycetota bacterium]
MKKLEPKFWDIVEKIKKGYTPKKIILYGSFAYGHPDRNSDIDLLIIKDTSERHIDRRVRVRRIADIRDSSYPAFSPIVLTPRELNRRLQIGDQFVKEIINKGKVLYAK